MKRRRVFFFLAFVGLVAAAGTAMWVYNERAESDRARERLVNTKHAVQSVSIALEGYDAEDQKISDAAMRLLRPIAIRGVNLENADGQFVVVNILCTPSIRDVVQSHHRTMKPTRYNETKVVIESERAIDTDGHPVTTTEDVIEHRSNHYLVYAAIILRDGSSWLSPLDALTSDDEFSECLMITIHAIPGDVDDQERIRPLVDELFRQCGPIIDAFVAR